MNITHFPSALLAAQEMKSVLFGGFDKESVYLALRNLVESYNDALAEQRRTYQAMEERMDMLSTQLEEATAQLHLCEAQLHATLSAQSSAVEPMPHPVAVMAEPVLPPIPAAEEPVPQSIPVMAEPTQPIAAVEESVYQPVPAKLVTPNANQKPELLTSTERLKRLQATLAAMRAQNNTEARV